MYLNDLDWELDRDGGALRGYIGAEDDDEEGVTARVVVDVCPAGGTLVIFRSKKLLHEVMPAHRRRWALSMWIEEEVSPLDEAEGEGVAMAPPSGRRHGLQQPDGGGNVRKLSAAVKWYGRVMQCTPPHSPEWLVAARGVRATARSLQLVAPTQFMSESSGGGVHQLGPASLLLDEGVAAWLPVLMEGHDRVTSPATHAAPAPAVDTSVPGSANEPDEPQEPAKTSRRAAGKSVIGRWVALLWGWVLRWLRLVRK